MIQKDHLKLIIMVLLVLSLGMTALNQTFSWYYKIELLANPCDACRDYNPQYKECFDYQSKIIIDPQTGKEVNESKYKINITNLNP